MNNGQPAESFLWTMMIPGHSRPPGAPHVALHPAGGRVNAPVASHLPLAL